MKNIYIIISLFLILASCGKETTDGDSLWNIEEILILNTDKLSIYKETDGQDVVFSIQYNKETDLTDVIYSWELPNNAFSKPESGEIIDLKNNKKVNIEVTLDDGSVRYCCIISEYKGVSELKIELNDNLTVKKTGDDFIIGYNRGDEEYLKNIKLDLQLPKGSVSTPKSGDSIDISEESKHIETTLADGTKKIQTISSEMNKSNLSIITKVEYNILETIYTSILNQNTKKGTLTIPYNYISNIYTSEIKIYHSNYSLIQIDYTQLNDSKIEVTLTVTSEDETSVEEYTILIDEMLSSSNILNSFVLNNSYNDFTGIIDENNKTISIDVPYNTSLQNIYAITNVSTDAVIFPKDGNSFVLNTNNQAIFSVTAEDGEKQNYTLHINELEDTTEATIHSITYLINGTEYKAIINETELSGTLILPNSVTLHSVPDPIVVHSLNSTFFLTFATTDEDNQYLLFIISSLNVNNKTYQIYVTFLAI